MMERATEQQHPDSYEYATSLPNATALFAMEGVEINLSNNQQQPQQATSLQNVYIGNKSKLVKTVAMTRKQDRLETVVVKIRKDLMDDSSLAERTESQNKGFFFEHNQQLYREYCVGKLFHDEPRVVSYFSFDSLENILNFQWQDQQPVKQNTPPQLLSINENYSSSESSDKGSTKMSLDFRSNIYAIVLEDLSQEWVSLEYYIRQNNIEFEAENLIPLLQIAIEAVEALSAVHQRDVSHRKVHPRNLMIRFLPNEEKNCKIKVIDFSNATLLRHETPSILNQDHIDYEFLHYMSPEQTGRFNRWIDFRTDLYSIGCVLYELFTCMLPFTECREPFEIIQHILSKRVTEPVQFAPSLPKSINDIILKCLEKEPDDRYQSCFGLLHDLKTCLKLCKENQGSIASFELGTQDIRERFFFLQKLIGREEEIEKMINAFERVKSREVDSYLFLCSGFSGIGKSQFVGDGMRYILNGSQLYCCYGKSDQYKTMEPYFTIIAAIKSLIHQLLNESEDSKQNWARKIKQKLSNNLSLVLDIVPEVAQLFTSPNDVREYLVEADTFGSNLVERQNRFIHVLSSFFSLFADEGSPLVLLLDDCQWLDKSSIELLKSLLERMKDFFVACIYRDNEVTEEHPLLNMITSVDAQGILSSNVSLKPLTEANIIKIVQEVFKFEDTKAKQLAEFVYKTTTGNPFYSNMLLKTLTNEKAVHFDSTQRRWCFQIQDLSKVDLSNNVVELMVLNVKRFSAATQEVLSTAALLGSTFDLKHLVLITELDEAEVTQRLFEVVEKGLIIPSSKLSRQLFTFLHDRVHEACALLIDNSSKKPLQLNIARLLLTSPEEEIEESLFYIVEQYNAAKTLIESKDEVMQLVALNRKAISKAKDVCNWAGAFHYCTEVISMLPDRSWEEEFSLTFSIYCDYLECSALINDFASFEAVLPKIKSHISAKNDMAKVAMIQAQKYEIQGKYVESIAVITEALSHFGVTIPSDNDSVKQMFQEEMNSVFAALKGKDIFEHLVNQEEMRETDQLIVMNLFDKLYGSTFYVNPLVFSLINVKMTNYCVQHGKCIYSSVGYTSFALAAFFVDVDIKTLYAFGKAGAEIALQYKLKNLLCTSFSSFNSPTLYTSPCEKSIELLHQAFQYGVESGSVNTIYTAQGSSIYEFLIVNRPIYQIEEDIVKHLDYLRKNNKANYDLFCAFAHGVRELVKPDAKFNAAAFEKDYPFPFFQMGLRYPILVKGILLGTPVTEQDADICTNYALAAAKALYHFVSAFFYCGLTYMMLADKNPTRRDELLAKSQQMIDYYDKWRHSSKNNFEHLYWILIGQRAKILGKKQECITSFQNAIAAAKDHKRFVDYCLAQELFAQFWLAQNCQFYARIHIEEAISMYQYLGARNKINHMIRSYSGIVSSKFLEKLQGTEIQQPGYMLDVVTIVKAAQVISKDIDPTQLITNMMKLLLENTKCERIVFCIITQENELFIKTEAKTPNICVFSERKHLEAIPLPYSLIRQSATTQTPVFIGNILADRVKEENAAYFSNSNVKSVCVLPLRRRAIRGLLYFETSAFNAFSQQDKVEILNLIFNQLLISLENIQYFEQRLDAVKQVSEERVKAREAEEYKRKLEKFLDSICHNLRNPSMGIKSYSEFFLDSISKLPSVIQNDNQFKGKLKELQEYMEIVLKCANHERLLIDDALAVSKLESNSTQLNLAPLNLLRLLRKVLQHYTDRLHVIFINQVLLLSKESKEEDVSIIGDEEKLQTICNILLQFCFSKTTKGEIHFTATVTENPENVELNLEVSDTSDGMTAEDKEGAFDRFSQPFVNKAKDYGESDSSGLTLIVFKKLVDLMKGTVVFDSKLGQGNTFKVCLNLGYAVKKSPRIQALYTTELPTISTQHETLQETRSSTSSGSGTLEWSPATVPTTSGNSATPKRRGSFSGTKKVLVVEDNLVNQKVLMRYVNLFGHLCSVASNGLEAIEKASAEQFDIIFMDVSLPIMDGMEASKKIREKNKTIPIIGLSGHTLTIEQKSIFNDYIQKPYDRHDISMAISKWTP